MDPRYSLKPDGNIPSSITLDGWTKFVLMCHDHMTKMNHWRTIVRTHWTLYLQSSQV